MTMTLTLKSNIGLCGDLALFIYIISMHSPDQFQALCRRRYNFSLMDGHTDGPTVGQTGRQTVRFLYTPLNYFGGAITMFGAGISMNSSTMCLLMLVCSITSDNITNIGVRMRSIHIFIIFFIKCVFDIINLCISSLFYAIQ